MFESVQLFEAQESLVLNFLYKFTCQKNTPKRDSIIIYTLVVGLLRELLNIHLFLIVGMAMEAPAQQILDSEIHLTTLQRDDSQKIYEVALLHYDGFGGKRCCLCCGDTTSELESNLKSAVKWVPDSKLESYGLAIASDKVVGFAQLGFHDTPGDVMMPICFRSSPKSDTCHLERIVVSNQMRGKGVGTQLLNWVDAKAREKNCKKVKLEVVSNNPAKKLYERQGYVSHTDNCQKVCMCPMTCFLMGHLYFDAMYKTL